jgi:Flp pilus assembly pilin Flp
MDALRMLWRDDAGAVQAETAIFIAFVALAGIGLWRHLG